MIKAEFKPSTTKGSERGELIQFFVDNIVDKKGKKYRIAFIGMKLSHLQLPDLYFMKSCFVDIERRSGIESARKNWWWSIK